MPGQTRGMIPKRRYSMAIALNRAAYAISRHWMAGFSLAFGIFVGLPFLAPVFMEIGWELPAKAIYAVYSFLCHQLPQRSYFLFGESFTYPLSAFQALGLDASNFLTLRQFVGNAEMGWKVAWSDRMASMYGGILLFAWIWYLLRRRIRPLSLKGMLVLAVPMAIDGFSHMISDFAGLGQGFRDGNVWLAILTNAAFPASFYLGDGWGSFNSIMRLITGLLLGMGVVWFGFPYLEEYFSNLAETIRSKFDRAGLML